MGEPTIGRITQLSAKHNIDRILNLEDTKEEGVHGKVDLDRLRAWWGETKTIGNISQKKYRTLDEFEEFVKIEEGIA